MDSFYGQCTGLLDEYDAANHCVAIEPRLGEEEYADLRLRFRDRSWLQSKNGEQLIKAFKSLPAIASLRRRGSSLFLVLHDEALSAHEEQLASGDPAGMDAHGHLSGQVFEVSLVGPNTNKALHIGHLRNIILGQALISALQSAGAIVRRHSLVGDIGRRVCEAMAGYITDFNGQTPQGQGLPGDRFVELCSRAYVNASGLSRGIQVDSEPGEREVPGDPADAIMKAWLQGGESERALWERMRSWVLEAHENTLLRLGPQIDQYDFESADIGRAYDLIDDGLNRGIFIRDTTDAVIYFSGRPEYAAMVLLNKDGVPTECARLLAVYHRVIEELEPDSLYFEMLGDEWRPAQTVLDDLLNALLDDSRATSYGWAYYGSVTANGRKIGSSTGQVTWIDDLLDEIAASPNVDRLYDLAEGLTDRWLLADILIRGTFLCRPMLQPLEFDAHRLRNSQAIAGWKIAAAWCHALVSRCSVGEGQTPRAMLVQANTFPQSLTRVIQKRDPTHHARFLLRLADGCLAAPDPGPAAMTILRLVFGSLGFLAGKEDLKRPRNLADRLTGPLITDDNTQVEVSHP